MNIKQGDIVQGYRWAEPIEVNIVEEIGDYVRVVGVALNSRQHIDQLIHRDEITSISSGKLESANTVKFHIVGSSGYGKLPKGFLPEEGTISRAVVVCPICASVIDDQSTRNFFKFHQAGQKLLAVVLSKKRENWKILPSCFYE